VIQWTVYGGDLCGPYKGVIRVGHIKGGDCVWTVCVECMCGLCVDSPVYETDGLRCDRRSPLQAEAGGDSMDRIRG
jgi:hypothetical protein